MDRKEDSCKECHFWFALSNYRDEVYGECKRKSPQINFYLDNGINAQWPIVPFNKLCGEYKSHDESFYPVVYDTRR